MTTKQDLPEKNRAALRKWLDVFTKFVHNCQAGYCIGENATIDEMLPAFRANCPFRQYIPSKPSKYGIKIYALVDAKMFSFYNLEIYTGKENEGPFRISKKAPSVIKRLTEPLFSSGRNITPTNRSHIWVLWMNWNRKYCHSLAQSEKTEKSYQMSSLLLKAEQNTLAFSASTIMELPWYRTFQEKAKTSYFCHPRMTINNWSFYWWKAKSKNNHFV